MKHSKDWVKRVGALTADHRAAKAAKLERQARRRVWARRAEGFSDTYARDDGQWHRARAKAQLERVSRVEACGASILYVSCVGCKKQNERRIGCRVRLLCARCRKAIAGEKRASFRRARHEAVAEASRRGLLNVPHYKRWSEKFLTLTAPHFLDLSMVECIGIVLDAWGSFLRKLNRFLADRDARSAEFFRVFEWTPGRDGRGHPHLHVWLLSPFLPREELQRWWGEALAKLTGEVAALQAVIHLCVADHDVDQELIKYLTKDIMPDGSKVAPEAYAEVYKALDERRSTQASKGFMARADRLKHVCECGCALPKNIRRVRAPDGKAPGTK